MEHIPLGGLIFVTQWTLSVIMKEPSLHFFLLIEKVFFFVLFDGFREASLLFALNRKTIAIILILFL